jgi:hypothetical protein
VLRQRFEPSIPEHKSKALNQQVRRQICFLPPYMHYWSLAAELPLCSLTKQNRFPLMTGKLCSETAISLRIKAGRWRPSQSVSEAPSVPGRFRTACLCEFLSCSVARRGWVFLTQFVSSSARFTGGKIMWTGAVHCYFNKRSFEPVFPKLLSLLDQVISINFNSF